MIRLTEDARADLQSIAVWIKREGGTARAASVTGRIVANLRLLERFPHMGRPGRVDGTRELTMPRLPYLSVYELDGPDVVILRVLHGAQLWPPEESNLTE